jgi:hypothetical protein
MNATVEFVIMAVMIQTLKGGRIENLSPLP